MNKKTAPLVVGLIAAVLMPADARAQLIGADSPPSAEMRRPYRGLFGSPGDPNAPQSLTLSASLFGAYDDNVTAEFTGIDRPNRLDPRLHRRGAYYGANAGLQYALSRSSRGISFGLSSNAFANTYRIERETKVVPHASLTGNLGIALGRRSSLQLLQQAIYSRYYRFQLFPSELGADDDGALAGDPDLELFARTALRYSTGVGLEHRLTQRSSLAANYTFGQVDYQDDRFADWRSHAASFGYNHRLSTNASLNLGYGYRTAMATGSERRPRELHDLNIGVDYSRALSFSRRTSVRFGTGSSITVSERLNVSDSDPRARFNLLGNVGLTHELGRTWTAYATYRRGLNFREGFDEPFLTDAVSTGLAGFITQRLDLSFMAGWSYATQNVGRSNSYDAFVASAHARYALGRYLALFARYVYYRYDFGDDIPLDPGLVPSLDRRGVRVGLTTSIPLIR